MNPNEALLVWGDVGGCVNILFFSSAQISLFERPPAPAGEKQGKIARKMLILDAAMSSKNMLDGKC